MYRTIRRDGYSVEIGSGNFTMLSMHHHDQYELYYLEAGNREYFVEDSFFSVSAGEFVLIAPGRLHRTGGTYGLRKLVMFSADCLHQVYTPDAASQLLQCFERIHIIPNKKMLPQLCVLLTSLEEAETPVQFAVYLGHLLCILALCEEEKSCNPGISGIIRYINQNYSTITNIDQIAKACYLSKFYLCHTFRQAMGITVVDYLNQVRIKTACVHLASEGSSIQTIAAQCGFHSVAYFSTIFKKHMGMTPSQYRIQKRTSE